MNEVTHDLDVGANSGANIIPAASGKKTKRPYTKHGLATMKKAVNALGSRAIDRRTSLGKALDSWRAELIADLGGSEVVSVQELTLVNLAVKSKLLLDSIDTWLLQQASLINTRKRSLHPVVMQRTQLADALARYMQRLGLKKRSRPAKTLSDLLAHPPASNPEQTPADTQPAEQPAA